MIKQMLTKMYYIGICDKCGKTFKGHFRRNADGSYREQKYCSIDCYAKASTIIDSHKYIARSIGNRKVKLEHDLIAEQMLGRPLNPGEVVHHKDGNKSNNDPSNLRVYNSHADHVRHHNCNPLAIAERQLDDGSYVVRNVLQVVDVFTPENTAFCPYCGKPFVKYSNNVKYCSEACRTKYNNDKRIEKYGPGYSHKHVGKNAYLNDL